MISMQMRLPDCYFTIFALNPALCGCLNLTLTNIFCYATKNEPKSWIFAHLDVEDKENQVDQEPILNQENTGLPRSY